MDSNDASKDAVVGALLDMGFDFSTVIESVEAAGNSLNKALEFIFSANSSSSAPSQSNANQCRQSAFSSAPKNFDKNAASSKRGVQKKKQSLITQKLQPESRENHSLKSEKHLQRSQGSRHEQTPKQDHADYEPIGEGPKKTCCGFADCGESQCDGSLPETDVEWEQRAEYLLQKHFGYKKLKEFQKDALRAWATHQDCLILAATGSGKSLCFQLPALLSGKVVVVISPLISLMHDQCLKLARHGISACFLGSGQGDKNIEGRALSGVFDIVYVCPETLMRLLPELQNLAKVRGIALFAIDEAHCVSKWGHDFRPAYRCLSVLREQFHTHSNIQSTSKVPIMALTATATLQVRSDIISSLQMDKDARIAVTSFFRPNLRFSVHHSKTTHRSSYKEDFKELINIYTNCGNISDAEKCKSGARRITDNSDIEKESSSDSDESFFDYININNEGYDFEKPTISCSGGTYGDGEMTVSFLEDEKDENIVEDFDVLAGEFKGSLCNTISNITKETVLPFTNESSTLELGPSIIYAPTRKETELLTQFLCESGVKASAYHAGLPKSHLRKVHGQFHNNSLQVVVATVAFGMGIDKPNVRRIIHYGLPQSLDSYYQEAGRAGRDGLPADCVLYTDMTRLPSLLPSKRDAIQTEVALQMLADCFRYGVSTSRCRAKILVEYFGEDFKEKSCGTCDVCVKGPPKLQDLGKEAEQFLHVLVALQNNINYRPLTRRDNLEDLFDRKNESRRISFRMVTQLLQEQDKMKERGRLWWRGFARMLLDKGFIREIVDSSVSKPQFERRICHVKFLEATDLGIKFLEQGRNTGNVGYKSAQLYLYPEGDMLVSITVPKKSFDWTIFVKGKGRKRKQRGRSRKSEAGDAYSNTSRGRISAKLRKISNNHR